MNDKRLEPRIRSMPWAVISSGVLILSVLGYSITEMLRILEGGMPNPWSLFVFLAALFMGASALSSSVWLFFWARSPRGDLTTWRHESKWERWAELATALFFGGMLAMEFVALAKGAGKVFTSYRIPFMYQTVSTMANVNFIFYWIMMLCMIFWWVTRVVYFFRYSPLAGTCRRMIIGR